MGRRRGTAVPALLGLLALLGGCASRGPGGSGAAFPNTHEVVGRVVTPGSAVLVDRGIRSLGVLDFEGPSGPELAARLAARLTRQGAFAVRAPDSLRDQLMTAGLALHWEPESSSLQWARDRIGLDGVVVGRVEGFYLEPREEAKDTPVLEGTGKHVFGRNEAGKIVYREVLEYRQVQLFCRTDRGHVAVSYRVWDARRAAVVFTVRHEITAEVPSFCYREDVPARLQRQAESRLLQRLFDHLNEQFVNQVSPTYTERKLAFERFPAAAGSHQRRTNELAILEAAEGDWEAALELWRGCLAASPHLAAAHYNLGMAYLAAGRLESARQHLKTAVGYEPSTLHRRAWEEVRGL